MKYFKNTELAKLYHVSEKSVRNWIEAARSNKLNLQLHEEKGKFYVANVAGNVAVIEKLVERGKKYVNRRGAVTLRPTDDFYRKYNNKQVLDIISSIQVHKELPLQYTYVSDGSESWDRYATRLSKDSLPNILTRTIELLDSADKLFDLLFAGVNKINVIDLGPGNGLPIRQTLERLIKKGRLGKYIAVDISEDMIRILEKNMRSWFDNDINFEYYIRDVSYERFNDLLAANYGEEGDAANIVCLFGGTLSNFRAPDQVLQAINNSMGTNDLLAYTCYLDSPRTRLHFDYDEPVNKKLSVQEKLILDLLNIDDSLYEVKQEFNEKEHARTTSILPVKDITVVFELPTGTRRVELQKGKPILIWRHKHMNMAGIINLFARNGFNVMGAMTADNDFGLIISKIKTNY